MSTKKRATTGNSTSGGSSDSLYRTLFRRAGRGLAIARVLFNQDASPADLSFLDVNAVFQEQSGWSATSRLREAGLDRVQQDRWVEACGRAALTGTPQAFEHRTGGKCLDVSAFRLGEEDEGYVAIVLDDVTHLKQADLEIRRQRERLSSITDLLVTTKMQLSLTRSAVQEPGLLQLLEKASRLLDDSIGQSRVLTASASPPKEYESGLIPGLTQLAAWIEERHQMRVIVESNADLKPEHQHVAAVLFAVTREVLFGVIRHARANEARVSLSEKDGLIRLTVEDNGVGFDPARGRQSTPRGRSLTKARERLHRIGGTLEVESEPGRGTRVTAVTPPLAVAGPGSALPQPADTTDLTARFGTEAAQTKAQDIIRVLLVDDHQVLRQGLASLLEAEEGIEVVGEAGDGYEAIELARRLQPDVVTMDISMPRMNGIEATRKIKSEMPAVLIIGLSMYVEQEQARLLYEAGVDAYFSKGAPTEELIRTMRRIVRRDKGAS